MAKNKELNELIKRIKYQYDLNQYEIASKIGVKGTYLSDVLNGRADFNDTLRTKIYEVFSIIKPELSSQMYEGDMLKTESLPQTTPQDFFTAMLLPISAQGGSLNDFIVSLKNTDCERVVTPIKNVDFVITVTGDSMAPDYPNGSQVLVKKSMKMYL